MLFRSLLFVSFFGFGFAAVSVDQGSLHEKYEAGDTANLYCNITTNKEIIRSCDFYWEIRNELTSDFKELRETPKYSDRISVISHDFFSFMTIRDLIINDTEEILCRGLCFVDGDLQNIYGNGTALTITIKEQDQKPAFPWLKYLLFSINCTIFSFSLVILISILRKPCNRKNL